MRLPYRLEGVTIVDADDRDVVVSADVRVTVDTLRRIVDAVNAVVAFTRDLAAVDRITCEFYGPASETRRDRLAVTAWLRDRLASAGTDRTE